MARKNLLKGLIEEAGKDGPVDAESKATVAPPQKRSNRGAIGAVSQSIEALKARSLLDLDPFEIDAGGLQDRLESDTAEDAALLASIEQYGQQVPVLVRPHPDDNGRYQIVYGRRRVLALRDLGKPVKALVRDLDDTALVMAQGQENTARRGLSFIEKANFAAQMRDAQYDRKAICDALSIDKTVVSRMLLIIDRVGMDLVAHIGAAPSVGRDRWSHMANLIEERGTDPSVIIGVLTLLTDSPDSNQRFEVALGAIEGPTGAKKAAPKPRASAGDGKRQSRRKIQNTETGTPIAAVLLNPDKVVMTIERAGSGGFEDWLVDNLEEIHRSWRTRRGE